MFTPLEMTGKGCDSGTVNKWDRSNQPSQPHQPFQLFELSPNIHAAILRHSRTTFFLDLNLNLDLDLISPPFPTWWGFLFSPPTFSHRIFHRLKGGCDWDESEKTPYLSEDSRTDLFILPKDQTDFSVVGKWGNVVECG